jgi:hypothetical protein
LAPIGTDRGKIRLHRLGLTFRRKQISNCSLDAQCAQREVLPLGFYFNYERGVELFIR